MAAIRCRSEIYENKASTVYDAQTYQHLQPQTKTITGRQVSFLRCTGVLRSKKENQLHFDFVWNWNTEETSRIKAFLH